MKGIGRNCVAYERKFEDLSDQLIADLPLERLKPSSPFYATGSGECFGQHKGGSLTDVDTMDHE